MTSRERHSTVLVGGGIVALFALLGAAFLLRDRTPLLTREALERARAVWDRTALADYDITLRKELDARPVEHVRTEVRGGKSVGLAIDGKAVAAKESYSVPGLFDVLETELEMAVSKDHLPGQPVDAILKALFHDATGTPVILKRIASNRKSYVITVEKIEIPGKEVVWRNE